MARVGELYDVTYSNWEADTFQMCVCDYGYAGPDCSHALCQRGDNPITTGDVNVEIDVSISATSPLSGSVSLTFQGVTADVPADGSASSTDACVSILKYLPFDSEESTCTQSAIDGTTGSATYSISIVFDGAAENNLFSHDGNVVDADFECTTSGVTGGDDAACTVQITNPSATHKEFDFCSGQGICNFVTGTCTCFEGYMGMNCGMESQVVVYEDDDTGFQVNAGGTSYVGSVLDLTAGRSAHADFKFIDATANGDNVFSVDGAGLMTTKGGVNVNANDVSITSGSVQVGGTTASVFTTSSTVAGASAVEITYGDDSFVGDLLTLKSPSGSATDATTFDALSVEFNDATVFSIRGDGQLGVEKGVFADGMVFQGTTSVQHLAVSGNTEQHGNVAVLRDDAGYSTVAPAVTDAVILGHVGTGSAFSGSVVAATTDVTAPSFKLFQAAVDSGSTTVFDVDGSGATTIHQGGLFVTAGGVDVTSGGVTVQTGGLSVSSGGVSIADGGLTTANTGGVGIHVTDGGVEAVNSASNAATMTLSATSSDFINTVALMGGAATDPTGYNLVDAQHNGVSKFIVQGDGQTRVTCSTPSSSHTDGALVVDGGVGVAGNINVNGAISDGVLTIESGVISDAASLTATGSVVAQTITDGTMSSSSGIVSNVQQLAMDGDVVFSPDTSQIQHSGSTSLTLTSTTGVVMIEGVRFDGQVIGDVSSIEIGGSQVIGAQEGGIQDVSADNLPNDGVIGALTFGATYSSTEIDALRDECEKLRDIISDLRTTVNTLITTMENHGLIATTP